MWLWIAGLGAALVSVSAEGACNATVGVAARIGCVRLKDIRDLVYTMCIRNLLDVFPWDYFTAPSRPYPMEGRINVV